MGGPMHISAPTFIKISQTVAELLPLMVFSPPS